jgi:hypothetical protein
MEKIPLSKTMLKQRAGDCGGEGVGGGGEVDALGDMECGNFRGNAAEVSVIIRRHINIAIAAERSSNRQYMRL